MDQPSATSACNRSAVPRPGAPTVATARAVEDLYDQLSMTLPPETSWQEKAVATRSRNHARARRWVPPLALDDDQVDEPGYQPVPAPELKDAAGVIDHAAVHRRLEGDKSVRLHAGETAEVARRAVAAGMSHRRSRRTSASRPTGTSTALRRRERRARPEGS